MSYGRGLGRLPAVIRVPMGLAVLGVLVFTQYTAFSGKRSFEQLQADERQHAEARQEHTVDAPRVTLPPVATAQDSDSHSNRPLMMGAAVVGMAAVMLFAGGFAIFSLLPPTNEEDDVNDESGPDLA